ncbi:hypothetical protein BGZ65_009370, partial [Modicella reniformis]
MEKQQQTLNHQVILENHIQAVMTQNYELHEYPIPRLSIVLPKPKRRRDKVTSLEGSVVIMLASTTANQFYE